MSEIENLPVVKNSRINEERKISGIFIYYDKVEVLLLREMPELDEFLQKYPPAMVTVEIGGVNPTT